MKSILLLIGAFVSAFILVWFLITSNEAQQIDQSPNRVIEELPSESFPSSLNRSLPRNAAATGDKGTDARASNEYPVSSVQALTIQELVRKVNLNGDEVRKIKQLFNSGPLSIPKITREGSVTTMEEAFQHINININMAYVPENYYEDDDYFFFSGGTSAKAVRDFSSGLAVNKKDGEIISW